MSKKYYPGMCLGPYNILLIEDTGYCQIGTSGRSVRKGRFQCPFCGKIFESTLQHVSSGHTKSCGCLNYLDLAGQKFNKLTAIKKVEGKTDKNGNFYWLCKCDCGNETTVRATDLKNGKTISCGCASWKQDMIGKRFGRLLVISPYISSKSLEKDGENGKWKCLCDCGNVTYVATNHLLDGHSQSCGCASNSRGEERVEKILKELHTPYFKEYVFEDCVNPTTDKKLRFDFYLPDHNCCIEYDGAQHYQYSKAGWNTEERFQQNQFRDKLKNEYCSKNMIGLIRIPYWDYDNLDKKYLIEKVQNIR